MQALEAVQAVEAVRKAQKRIDREQYPESTTFFSENDLWEYDAVADTVVCEECRYYEEIGTFNGDLLRTFFPYMEIVDSDEIEVNVHPNCRCVLKRVINLPLMEE